MAAVVIGLICLIWLPKRLEFTYETEGTEYAPGDQVKVEVSAENVGRSFHYQGNGAYMVYLYTYVDGERYCIEDNQEIYSADATKYLWKRNQVRTEYFTYDIPEDAPAGKYSLYVTFEGVACEFEDVIEIK